MAILPFNILTDEGTPDPIRIGAAEALRQDLLMAPDVRATLVDDESGAYGAGATETILVTVTRRGSRLHGQLTPITLADQKAGSIIESDAGSYIALVNQLAQQIDSHAGRFSTSSDAALRDYVKGLTAPDRAAKEAALRQAIASDPHFGMAYFSLVDMVSADPEGGAQVITAAEAQSSGFTPLDRARIGVLTARMTHKTLAQQAQALQNLVAIAPNDVDSLAALGSERFLLGDGNSGDVLLRKAMNLAPNQESLSNRLGVGLMAVRRFDEAAVVFRRLQGDPSAQVQLASCLLLKGDAAGADQIMERYFVSQQRAGPALSLIRANWIAASKGLQQAVGDLSSQHLNVPALDSLAASQVAVWDVALAQDAQAAAAVAKATRTEATPLAKAFAAAALAAVSGKGDPVFTAYTLFLRHQYDQAAQAWSSVVEHTGNTDLRARAMLASSLQRAGHADEAKKILVQPFPFNVAAADPYSAIPFLEMRRLLSL